MLCIKSSVLLSLGHTGKPNLVILQKAKLAIFCPRTRHWSDYFWLWFQVIYLICLQCFYQHVFSHEEHINLVVALGKSKENKKKQDKKKLSTRIPFHKRNTIYPINDRLVFRRMLKSKYFQSALSNMNCSFQNIMLCIISSHSFSIRAVYQSKWCGKS